LRLFYTLAGAVLGGGGLFVIIIYAASELGGEVVTLVKQTSTGDYSNVRVWIVDRDDYAWIEHGEQGDFWLEQLVERPQLQLVRRGQTSRYTAVMDTASHDLYHQLRAEKYALANTIIQWMTQNSPEACTGMPVRLRPFL
jgi:hypothetical protein